MNSEKMLSIILKEFQGIKTEISEIKTEILGMKTEIQKTKDGLLALNNKVSTIESQLDENTQLTKAVLHRQEESDAKTKGISLDLAKVHEEVITTNTNVVQLSERQKSINEVLGEHEISIRSLRRTI